MSSPVGPLQIEEVERVPLGRVAEEFFADEGCTSPEDFKAVWRKLHPRAGWRPDQPVYLHRFHPVSG